MSYLPPSLRAERSGPFSPQGEKARMRGRASFPPRPLTAPEIIAATRLAVCEFCEHAAGGRCRLFGCCEQPLSVLVTFATRTCPAKRWAAWLPTQIEP